MALKWFNKTLFITLFLLCSCSSPAKKSFTVMELEKRADEYMVLADRFRLQGRTTESLQYYQSAQTLYFKKWNVEKYTLAGMKETTVHILQGDLGKARERLDYFKNVTENLGINSLLADIALSESMLFYAEGKTEEASNLLDTWCKKPDISHEKRQYMLFLRIWKTNQLPEGTPLEEMLHATHEIIEQYQNGELENQEIAFFGTLAMAEFLESKNNFDEAWKLLNKAVEIHRDSEVTIQWSRIFLVMSRVAQKLNKPELSIFYKKMHEEQIKAPLI